MKTMKTPTLSTYANSIRTDSEFKRTINFLKRASIRNAVKKLYIHTKVDVSDYLKERGVEL